MKPARTAASATLPKSGMFSRPKISPRRGRTSNLCPAAREMVYRLRFTKTGRARFLSHLELALAVTRALRRSSLALCYSAGFHPHPKISFATATPVGTESREEYLDVTAGAYPGDLTALKNEINAALPDGMAVTDLQTLPFVARELSRALYGFDYDLLLPDRTDDGQLNAMARRIDEFLAAGSFPITRQAKGKTVTRDIRPFVEKLALLPAEKKVTVTLLHAQNGSARPLDIIEHVLGVAAGETQNVRTSKPKRCWPERNSFRLPA